MFFLCMLLATSLPRTAALPIGLVPGSDHVVTGLVTYPASKFFIIEDGTNRFDIYTAGSIRTSAGDVIAVRCRLNNHRNGVTTRFALATTTIGHQELPLPRHVSLERILNEELFLQKVHTHGTVIDIAPDDLDVNTIQAVVRSGSATVWMPLGRDPSQSYPSYANLLHAEIEIEGFCLRRYPTARFMAGPVFHLSDNKALRIVKPATNRFNYPRFTADSFSKPSDLAQSGPRTLEGMVIAHCGLNRILIRDFPLKREDNVHLIELIPGSTPPPVGARIEAVGRPETDLCHLNLSQAAYRRLADETLPQHKPDPLCPKNAIGRDYYDFSYYGKVVRLQGTVISIPANTSTGDRIYLSGNGCDFALDINACPELLSRYSPGCVLEVCGVCMYESDNWRPSAPLPRIRGLTIIARNAHDIRLVSSPSWWTVERLVAIIFALLAIVAVFFAWNRILRHIIIRRSRQLLREQSARNDSELRIGERTRLAVELHDTLSQTLVGVACQITAAHNAVGLDDDSVRQRLDTAERTLESCRTELRQVLSDLRSDALELPDFNDAVRLVLRDVEDKASIFVRFNVPRNRLLDTTAHAILRIVRELAGNAVHHGHATVVKVAGAIDQNKLFFSVRENGSGFDLKRCPGPLQGHFGLQGIHTRIKHLGGTFQLDTAPGKGSHASFSIPLHNHGTPRD